VQLGSVRRLETIYRTNLQTAYQAGRWQAFDDNSSDRPYLMYVAVMDDRTRPSHAEMNGQIFPADDPIWDTHYPPNGFNCRCRVRALSEKNIQDRGLAVQSSAGRMHEKEVSAGVDKQTGEDLRVTVSGIEIPGADGRTHIMWTDPGWNYNPGKSAWQPDLKRYDADLARQFRNDTQK
jgi:SPP1 gp7 family putative phage head morphogenesis protein